MTKIKNLITVLVLLASVSIVPATATPIDDIRALLNGAIPTLSWYVPSVSYANGVVTFNVGYTESWSAVVLDPNGNQVGSTSGSGYGIRTMSITPTISGTYSFILNCPSSSCGKVDPFEVQLSPTQATTVVTPVITTASTAPTVVSTLTETTSPAATAQPSVVAPTPANPSIIPTNAQIIPSGVSAATGVKQSPGFGIIGALGIIILIARLRR